MRAEISALDFGADSAPKSSAGQPLGAHNT
jgi:hypothetical protein